MNNSTATVNDTSDPLAECDNAVPLEPWETMVGPCIVQIDCDHPLAPCAVQLDDVVEVTTVADECTHVDHLPCTPTPYDVTQYICTEDMLCDMCNHDTQYCVGSPYAEALPEPVIGTAVVQYRGEELAYTGATSGELAFVAVGLIVVGVLFAIVAKFLLRFV